MKPYQCVRPCFFGGRLWEVGEVAMFDDGKWPKDKDGKIRHFVPVNRLVAPPPPPPPDSKKSEEEDKPKEEGKSPKPKKAKK